MSADTQYTRGESNGKMRPPMVRFERKAVLDTRLTQMNGRSTYGDVDVVHVTSPGGGVTMTYNVDEWFERISGKFEYGPWLDRFRQMYQDWVDARDVSKIDGTPLAKWPLLSPGQVETFLDAGIESIQQMAELSDARADELGARWVRSQARYWLHASEDIGAVTTKAARLEAENATLQAQVDDLSKKFAEAKAENERLTQHFTGKEGYDIIAGRAQPAPLSVAQPAPVAQQPETPAASTTPAMPQGAEQVSFETAQGLSMAELRELCYESEVQPNPAKQETLKRLAEAGALSDVPDGAFSGEAA